MEKIISLIKAFRINENAVKVLYYHNEQHREFLVEWNNIHPETGEVIEYDLQPTCMSSSDDFSERVNDAIKIGESDSNPDLDLYLAIRDTFDYLSCGEID